MGSYNWIIVEQQCPVCHCIAIIRCQTHIASSYGGDDRGRFHDQEYRLGEEMNWWPKTHKEYSDWRVNGMIAPLETDPDYDRECCYSECTNCNVKIFVVIRFNLNKPIAVLEIGRENNWPADYFK